MPSLSIDPEITNARLPDAAFYADIQWFDAQMQHIFAQSWQLVGHSKSLEAQGRVVPVTLLPGAFEVPVVLTHAPDGRRRCLSNVCTHRGAVVVQQPGQVRSMRCPYHGRCFGLDGRFLSAPGFEGTPDFPCEADSLPELPLETWAPFLFSRLPGSHSTPAIPFDAWIEPLRHRMSWLPLAEFQFDAASSSTYDVDAHWALYCDNYLEGLHIPFVHQGLMDRLNFPAYAYELFDWGSLQVGIAGEGEAAFEFPPGHPEEGKRVGAFWFWLFPNLMLNFYPWGVSVNVVDPISPSQSRVRFLSYVWKPALRPDPTGGDLHQVELEDEDVVQRVQAGIRSPLYRPGRYSPQHERAVHHFHRLAAQMLARANKENGDK